MISALDIPVIIIYNSIKLQTGDTMKNAPVLLALILFVLTPASAQEDDLTMEEIVSGLDQPLYVLSHPDNANHLYILQKRGRIISYDAEAGKIKRRNTLNITSKVSSNSERGLLGMAFDNKKKRRIYISYTDLEGNSVISVFLVHKKKWWKIKKNSERVILYNEQPAANHNGGWVGVGPDGFLYIGFGDGGGANDQFGNGQNLQTYNGSILRVNPRRRRYKVPNTNPFAVRGIALPEIWAYGVRNPWRCSFDKETGDFWFGDVGQNAIEEINVVYADSPQLDKTQTGEVLNFAWDVFEGFNCFNGPGCNAGLFDMPVYTYDRSVGASVTGGYVYRGEAIESLKGYYIFGDYVARRIWKMHIPEGGGPIVEEITGQVFDGKGRPAISSFGQDADGELYICDLFGGKVYKIVPVEE